MDSFVNRKKAFRVSLKNGSMLFCAEGAFTDANIRHSAKLLLNIIREEAAAFGPVKTEKGTPFQNAQAFEAESAFHVIENVLSASHPWLLCDDEESEWCDFLSVLADPDSASKNLPEVRWYHAKLNRKNSPDGDEIFAMGTRNGSTSASGLQEVVGQAVKNLGRVRMHSQHEDVKVRRKLWEEMYVWPEKKKNSSPTKSDMLRLRRVGSGVETASPTSKVTQFLKAYDRATANPHTIFEVALVIPNYKKSTLKNAFDRLGTPKATQTSTQIFWLLSGFMLSCIEVGVRPVIYCR